MRRIVLIPGISDESKTLALKTADGIEGNTATINKYNIDYVMTMILIRRDFYGSLVFLDAEIIGKKLNALLFAFKYGAFNSTLIFCGDNGIMERIDSYISAQTFHNIDNDINEQRYDTATALFGMQSDIVIDWKRETNSSQPIPSNVNIIHVDEDNLVTTIVAKLVRKYHDKTKDDNTIVFLSSPAELQTIEADLSRTYGDSVISSQTCHEHYENKAGMILLTTSNLKEETVPNVSNVIDVGRVRNDIIGADNKMKLTHVPISAAKKIRRSALVNSVDGGNYIILVSPNIELPGVISSSFIKNSGDFSAALMWILLNPPLHSILSDMFYYRGTADFAITIPVQTLLYAKGQLIDAGLVDNEFRVTKNPYAMLCLMAPNVKWIRVMSDNRDIFHFILILMATTKYYYLSSTPRSAHVSTFYSIMQLADEAEKWVAIEYIRRLLEISVTLNLSLNDAFFSRSNVDVTALELARDELYNGPDGKKVKLQRLGKDKVVVRRT